MLVGMVDEKVLSAADLERLARKVRSRNEQSVVHKLVEASIRAAILLAAVALILALFRIRSSGTRHAAWTTPSW
jgi:hypothetical protein